MFRIPQSGAEETTVVPVSIISARRAVETVRLIRVSKSSVRCCSMLFLFFNYGVYAYTYYRVLLVS